MIRFETHSFRSELQRRLDADSANFGSMDVCSGDELLEITEQDIAAHAGLHFGPYGVSPVSGLHFDPGNDPVAA